MGVGVGLEVGHRLDTQESERAGGGREDGRGCGRRVNTHASEVGVSVCVCVCAGGGLEVGHRLTTQESECAAWRAQAGTGRRWE